MDCCDCARCYGSRLQAVLRQVYSSPRGTDGSNPLSSAGESGRGVSGSLRCRRWVNANLPRCRSSGGKISYLLSIMRLPFCATCAGLLLVLIQSPRASSQVPEGTWLFANKVALQVFECSGLLCGRIVWLVRPRSADGQPDVDNRNPDPTLRQRPLSGLTIIWGLQPNGPSQWSGGSLYDPEDGATYDVTAELTDPNTMSARVYRGAPLFGRTEILVRDPPLGSDGHCE